MNVKEAIAYSLKSAHGVVKMFLADLSDADLLVRPVPGANHIAWQLGHLLQSEADGMLGKILGGTVPTLPANLAAQHSKEMASNDDPAGFLKKDEYLALRDTVRAATLARLAEVSETDLDKPSGWADFAPTWGSVFALVANNDLMHAGQFTVVRRKLGKPVLM